MFGLGFSEIVVLGILALILLGPEQLPDLARKLGKFINELKRTTDGIKEEFHNSGINPSSLLDDIKREPTKPAASINTPQASEDLLPPENPEDLLKSGHEDDAHATTADIKPTGNNDDSGKK